MNVRNSVTVGTEMNMAPTLPSKNLPRGGENRYIERKS